MIDIFKALISGVVEGLTEFIPVSSTAHLLLLSWLIDFNSVKNYLFEIIIQSGAILAVCVLYRKKIFDTILHLQKKESKNFAINLILSFLPAAFAGLLLHDFIKSVLFSPIIVAVALIFGGIMMLIVDLKKREFVCDSIDKISFKQALILGFFQALAIIPGVSRSGSTIIGGLLLKINRRAAAEFSFFMSIIVIFSASFYDFYKNYQQIDFSNFKIILAGFFAAFISSILVIKWFINYVSKNNFIPFAIYRIFVGLLILFFIF